MLTEAETDLDNWATNPATCIFGGYIYIEA